ncbi:MAG TPA: YggS family pyridoxal phosphate-dependent enzyme [Mycobacteriales bacterium]|nr:YggS family pyridoxal phosphate-dependent enzyme [Mycobacteriales bacterium]
MSRRAELAASLASVRAHIAAACASAGRDAAEVTLVAVTKTFPASDIRLLAELGVTDIGENRDQEARAKHSECRDPALRWHFVGQLQRNKARSVATYADVVHSVDSVELASALDRGAGRAGRAILALVQVSLDGDPSRGGAVGPTVARVCAAVAECGNLRLGGVMAVAPQGVDADSAFADLAAVAADVRSTYPEATVISAGMSGDLDAAIRHGATHVRIGTALLGRRGAPVG